MLNHCMLDFHRLYELWVINAEACQKFINSIRQMTGQELPVQIAAAWLIAKPHLYHVSIIQYGRLAGMNLGC